MTNQPTETELNDKLKVAQGKHLRALEEWASRQPLVADVPVLQALTYDLIQVTNGAYLNAILKVEGPQPIQITEGAG